MQFTRSSNVPAFKDYPLYRPYLRKDFACHCAYCTGHEDELGGEDHFDIDHFRPKKKFPKLICEYSNLYYSCRGCNKNGAKGQHWPGASVIKAGYRFFDPVQENAYITHLRETNAGRLTHRTRVGEYSIRILRLNRDGLIILRKNRAKMRRLLRIELTGLLRELQRLKREGKTPPTEVIHRLGQVRTHLEKRPLLNLLPDWWNT
jgi:uncharacterized protein (TIGR02646 family)